MEVSPAPKMWTEEALLALPEAPVKYEVVHGELVMTPIRLPHEMVIPALVEYLRRYVRTERLGFVAGSDLGCWMKNGNLRCPDLSFIARERVKALVRKPAGFLYGAPDLAVEVLSPSDTLRTVRAKCQEYFESGCRLCWIVDEVSRTVLILRPDGSETLLHDNETLEGEDVVPGFSLPIASLFEDLDWLEE
jgi:Uma2 family endonuclease